MNGFKKESILKLEFQIVISRLTKMKILILSLLLSVQGLGQEWELINENSTKVFGFEYAFQFKNIEDTSTFILTKDSVRKQSVFRISNNQGQPVEYCNISLHNLENDSITGVVCDLIGFAKLNLEKGKYRLELLAYEYDNFELEVEIKENEAIDLQVNLGLGLELTIYQIRSKTRLKEDELLKIMNCVKMNRSEMQECELENQYNLSLQI